MKDVDSATRARFLQAFFWLLFPMFFIGGVLTFAISGFNPYGFLIMVVITVSMAALGSLMINLFLNRERGLISTAMGHRSWRSVREGVALFHVALLLTETAVLGVFLAADLFLFYLFWELQLLPIFMIIGRWGHGGRIRAAVQFRRLNLMEESFTSGEPLDAIFCRNVIIYFDRATQERLIDRFCRVLRPDGYLFLGHSESIHGFSLPLRRVVSTVYRKTE